MKTAIGSTLSGTTKCKLPNCHNIFVVRRVSDKYCETHRGSGNRLNAAKKIRWAQHDTEFIMIDGEGTGDGKNHKYVLLGVGDQQLERPDGFTDIREIFEFLYGQFKEHPDAAFCGYYLGYDFNMWLRLLPRDRALYLLTEVGRRKRARDCKCPKGKQCHHKRLPPHPVEYGGWQFDILGYKRLKLRPKTCACRDVTCQCKGQAKWMYVNDAGPFFQASLVSVIDPAKWAEPIVTEDEFRTILEGKSLRGAAQLDDDMRRYNRLENVIGARLLQQLNQGFTSAGIRLTKKQWFGPGQAAQAWMRLEGKLEHTTQAIRGYSQGLKDALTATYYGGWFEITCHGFVPGITYEYDINSAYPSIASRMPCLCGTWKHVQEAKGGPLKHGWLYGGKPSKMRLCYVRAEGSDFRLGGLPYRSFKGHVSHPLYTEGWYWQHEIDAARRAGLIDEYTCTDYWEYEPCNHRAPIRGLAGLYEGRQRVGKDTPEGKAYKLVYNSVYGKLAQSLGVPAFGNPCYASLITSGCRTMILDAIARHPDKAGAVVMIATDGVYFMSKHPELDKELGEGMGQWSRAEKRELTLFKPGVYWDNQSRELINRGLAPKFKARGISAVDFARSIADVDAMFDTWQASEGPANPWPVVTFRSRFSQVSVLQALMWTQGTKPPGKQEGKYRSLAGLVMNGKELEQKAVPEVKRNSGSLRYEPGVGVWRTDAWRARSWPPSAPYERRFGLDLEQSDWDEYQTPDGSVMLSFREALLAG